MKQAKAEKKMAKARDHLAAAARILRKIEDACREAGMDDDQGNVDVMERIYDVCDEIETEGIYKLK